jgi:TPP-dependent pyruvate/acetoin dehydrogenase alpha subunit
MGTQIEHFYLEMVRIRRFEETVLERFPRGEFFGTTHTYIGQEANAVGVLASLLDGDVVVSNHRCHGHFLAYGGAMHGLAAELMGRESGICGGRGGSQHIQWKDFYANGILGGTVALATGIAMAEKVRRKGKIVFCFMGDGTLGEGVVYESLNMASLWALPIVFILENNRYAQSTPIQLHLSGDIAARFEAFHIPTEAIDTTDVREVDAAARPITERIRDGQGPQALIIHTYRFAPHSKGDDHRDAEEISGFRERDPLPLLRLAMDRKKADRLDQRAEEEVERAFASAAGDPLASPGSILPVREKRP